MTSTVPPRRRRRPSGAISYALFAALLLGFAAVAVWVLAHGYASEFSLHRWSKVVASTDAGEFRIENIGLFYPHAPIYLLALFHGLPGTASAHAPHFLGVLAGAVLFMFWNQHLRRKGYTLRQRLGFLALMATHPFVLWAVTSGLHNALTLLGFYLFCYGCYLVVSQHDVRALVFVAMMLAAFFYTDERTLFVFLALLPLIPFLASPRMARESLASVYAIMAFPLLVAVGAWLYMNWIFHGNPWSFLEAPDSSFRGAWQDVGQSPWLLRWGGQWLMPTLVAAGMALAAFPVAGYLGWRFFRKRRQWVAGMVLFVHPVIAAGLATAAFFLQNILGMVFLLAGAVMGMLLIMPRLRGARVAHLLGLLALGNLAGWGVMAGEGDREVLAWRAGLLGQGVPAAQAGEDVRLGEWLREHGGETLLDDRVAYRAIVARGHGRGLILPFSIRFKNAVKSRDPGVAQILVLNPQARRASMDRVGERFPRLFREGMPGYERVYDSGVWRVYRRMDITVGEGP